MKNKITFKEAVQISLELKRVFQNLDCPEGIAPRDVKALWYLRNSETNNIKEIKEAILNKHKHLDKQRLNVRISKIVKHLVNASLIERKKDKNDKRETIILITKKGNELLKDVASRAEKIWNENYG